MAKYEGNQQYTGVPYWGGGHTRGRLNFRANRWSVQFWLVRDICNSEQQSGLVWWSEIWYARRRQKKCTVGSFNWDGITPPNIRIIFRFSLVKITDQPSLTWGISWYQPSKSVTNIKSSSSLKITVSLHGIMAKSPDLTFGDHNQVRVLSRYSYSDQHELNISIQN